MTLVYRLGERDGLPWESIIRIHALHAENHDGKVLLTTDSLPAKDASFEDLILTTADGKTTLRADVVAWGRETRPSLEAPGGFEQPSVWPTDDYRGTGAWFCLDVTSEDPIENGEFVLVSNGKELLSSFPGQQPIRYVKRSTARS